MELPAKGTCQCGNVTYRITREPLATAACHCRDCQKLSTSAFSITMMLERDGFELLTGDLSRWERPTEAGGTAVCWFCPGCGNRIYHENPAAPQFIRLKPGTLDDTSQIRPQVHVWTCREQPWLAQSPKLPRVDRQPDMAEAMAKIARGESPF